MRRPTPWTLELATIAWTARAATTRCVVALALACRLTHETPVQGIRESRRLTDALPAHLERAGRPWDAIRTITSVTVVAAETDDAARARLDDYARHVDEDGVAPHDRRYAQGLQ